jgi:membrane-bound lytic murein transglycosylase F
MLVQPKVDVTSKVRKQYELDGDTIWVQKNSPYIERLNDLAEEIAFDPVIIEMRAGGYEEMVGLVQKGEIKFTICPEYLTGKFKTRYDQVDFSLPLSLKHDLSWCVNAHSPLLQDRLNEFLYTFKETNDFQALLKKYKCQVEF